MYQLIRLEIKRCRIQIEFFPPATRAASSTFLNTIDQLAPLNPEFSSVTYGAGGSGQGRTMETIRSLVDGGLHKPAAHLTCVGASRAETNKVIDAYAENGIRHIIALRGDAPEPDLGFRPHPDENLDNRSLIKEQYSGIRPAPGYPACPDHSEKRTLFRLLNGNANTGVSLTENYAMSPAASVSGYYFSHPQSRYFGVSKVGQDQVEEYAVRKSMTVSGVERCLGPVLAYDTRLSTAA